MFLFAVLGPVPTVQSEIRRVKVEGHAVALGPDPIPDHPHVHTAGPIPVLGLAQFLHVDLILDLLPGRHLLVW